MGRAAFAWGVFQVWASGACLMSAAVRFGEGDQNRAGISLFFALFMLAMGVGRLTGHGDD